MLEPDHAAVELHDDVVRAIFAVGLHLQGTAEIAADPLLRRRIEQALSDLDDLVRIIRDAVFRLDRHLSDQPAPGNRAPVRTSPVTDAAFPGPADGAP